MSSAKMNPCKSSMSKVVAHAAGSAAVVMKLLHLPLFVSTVITLQHNAWALSEVFQTFPTSSENFVCSSLVAPNSPNFQRQQRRQIKQEIFFRGCYSFSYSRKGYRSRFQKYQPPISTNPHSATNPFLLSATLSDPVTELTGTDPTTTNETAHSQTGNDSPQGDGGDGGDSGDGFNGFNGFSTVIQKAIQTLIESDSRRGEFAGNSDGSSSQGRWLYDPAAKELQDVLDRLVLKLPQPSDVPHQQLEHDINAQWIRWMKNVPSPLFLDLTSYIHQQISQQYWSQIHSSDPGVDSTQERIPSANVTNITVTTTTATSITSITSITPEHLEFVDMTLDQFLSRIACHVILLPSGSETSPLSLVESTGAHIYGKLLYGGVTRYRLLNSGNSGNSGGGSGGRGGRKKVARRAGEKREVISSSNGPQSLSQQSQQSQPPTRQIRQISHPSWVQLGGTERRYEALDIGPAAILELTLLPRLWQDLPTVFDKSVLSGGFMSDMTLSNAAAGWDPSDMFELLPEGFENSSEDAIDGKESNSPTSNVFQTVSGKERNIALTSHFQSHVGGLQPQIDAIVRRVLDGRSIYSQQIIESEKGNGAVSKARLEAEELAALGLRPVRGLLLYGKPGTGKTALVREIARALGARPPKIVSAPELLDRWVGGSEKSVRELFKEAEEELALYRSLDGADEMENNQFLSSSLHVIVIDEIDAVFRKRIDSNDSGSMTRNSMVNQLLAKLDGVHALPNILMIGMTNRRELLDDALLRAGRLEVQVEVPMPEKEGRREIMQIHFGALRKRGRLSYPLCCAIDGVNNESFEKNQVWNAGTASKKTSRRSKMFRTLAGVRPKSFVDLADEKYSGGFSGADIAGLVRNSGSLALARARLDGSGVEGILITLEDVLQAIREAKM